MTEKSAVHYLQFKRELFLLLIWLRKLDQSKNGMFEMLPDEYVNFRGHSVINSKIYRLFDLPYI
jgi:hypothetical protein